VEDRESCFELCFFMVSPSLPLASSNATVAL
jgi:hypothetical protein